MVVEAIAPSNSNCYFLRINGADLPYQAPEHNAGHSSFPLPGPGLSLNYSLILGKEEWGREGPGKGFVAREAAVRARGPHWRLAL